jgi:hypothetical protein
MREHFDRSLDIDLKNQSRLVLLFKGTNGWPVLDKEEQGLLKAGMNRFGLFERKEVAVKKVAAESASVTKSTAKTLGQALDWGKCEALVPASKEEVLAFMWDVCARRRWDNVDLIREVLEEKNDHNCVWYVRKGKAGGFNRARKWKDRDGVNRAIWSRLDSKTLAFVSVSTEHAKRPETDGAVRSHAPVSTMIREVRPGFCRVTHIAQLDLGGNMPSWAQNLHLKKVRLRGGGAKRGFSGARVWELGSKKAPRASSPGAASEWLLRWAGVCDISNPLFSSRTSRSLTVSSSTSKHVVPSRRGRRTTGSASVAHYSCVRNQKMPSRRGRLVCRCGCVSSSRATPGCRSLGSGTSGSSSYWERWSRTSSGQPAIAR